jgi:hypothetical protein
MRTDGGILVVTSDKATKLDVRALSDKATLYRQKRYVNDDNGLLGTYCKCFYIS